MKNDELGDRQKFYEKNNIVSIFPKGVPVIARIDGRCFSKFTKGMERPFCYRMGSLMRETAKFLLEETGAKVAYTQSDEITLIWFCGNPKSELWFGGKMQKMVSQLAALATMKFNFLLYELKENKLLKKNPTFDARVWFVPSKIEACNALLWRERDAIKNSISMAAQTVYSHKELQNKSSNEKQEMLFQKGINWNNFHPHFKRGTLFRKTMKSVKFSSAEINKLPENHEARKNPDLKVDRSVIEVYSGEFGKVEDKIKFIFG